MKLKVRRNVIIRDEIRETRGQVAEPPVRKIAVVSVVENPFVDRFQEDLSPLIEASVELGHAMAALGARALEGEEVQSYGKAGLVGVQGEQEHANALLTTAFATPFRDMIGLAPAWISSVTKVAAPGATIDIPVNNIHDVYVRSHYDTMSFAIADIPLPDEIAVIFCMVTRGRIGARVGGMTHDEAVRQSQAARAESVR
ncbi:amino acid synthesis family protein [Xanthobacter sediminis]